MFCSDYVDDGFRPAASEDLPISPLLEPIDPALDPPVGALDDAVGLLKILGLQNYDARYMAISRPKTKGE